jgi:hypothetical protein
MMGAMSVAGTATHGALLTPPVVTTTTPPGRVTTTMAVTLRGAQLP